ncbi:MAG TPA: tail fiber domain-containing protein [Candidatus Udaeobacter sp.]|nr:tail fiber domain-containing protein [Candidatus Udaeobacter sp.]
MQNRNASFTKLLLLGFLVLCPIAQAVSPAPDGGYPGFNTAEGQNALKSLATGVGDTAIGWFSLWSNTDGSFNTAVGAGTLLFNVGNQSTGEGIKNTSTGAGALLSNITGSDNTANGAFALFNNTTGYENTANGSRALYSNTVGTWNTAVGCAALQSNTEGSQNTATGLIALSNNTTGGLNTATGYGALSFNTVGNFNTANGVFALEANTGSNNTAIGNEALRNYVSGDRNTAVGSRALWSTEGSGIDNTAVGYNALNGITSGNGNIAIGLEAGSNVTTANNVICIGSDGANLDQSCFIGNIRDVATQFGDAIPVVIDSVGQLGTASSSRRFKKEIKPMDRASESILALKPVTFQYKSDTKGIAQFGLIAEEVAEVNPNLVVRDKEGKPYTVRYDQVNAMLLNEFLKAHRKVEELEKGMATLTAQLKGQAAQIQKISAQIRMSELPTKVASLSAVSSRPAEALREGGSREGGNNP